MKVLPAEKGSTTSSSTTTKSNYQGSLPSQKYFTPKELNSLSQVGKRPDSNTKKRLQEELKKSNQPVKATHSNYTNGTDLLAQTLPLASNTPSMDKA
jgi:hypothetical protein